MSSDTEDYIARVLEEEIRPVVDSDSSKWVAVHDTQEPSAPGGPSNAGPGYFFTVAWILGITLGLIWVMRNGRTVFEQWQENVHRRANRRRHGIPDDDDRPFNVAYAAAALDRRLREENEKTQARDARREPKQHDSGWAMHGDPMLLRQRSSQATGPPFGNGQPVFMEGSSVNPLGGVQSRPQPSNDPRVVQSYDWSGRRQSGLGQSHTEDRAHSAQPLASSSNMDPGRRNGLDGKEPERTPAERRKYDELDDTDDEGRLLKKSRVNGPGVSRHGSLQVPKRGSKRHANEEADDDWEMSQDKRARKGSATHTPEEEDLVDVDMTQEESDAELTRGTKRDREEESTVEGGTSNSPPTRPARKRRAGKDDSKPQEPSRGRKRDRSQESSGSSDEDEEDDTARTTRRKRGKRLQEDEEDTDIVLADASESEAEISSDPACGGRRIGESWEINGQSFKVGLDGRRLRHALIKQSRTKFPMPKDSAHTDASTNVDVIVEKWLNDDEYKLAKEKFELAWQDASPVSTPDKELVPAKSVESSSPIGKRLLWGGPPPSSVKGRLSVIPVSNVQNPFDLAPSNAGRRVASVQLLIKNNTETPKLRNSKSFSKWEKQDLEANSLKKMRARMEKQKAEAAATATTIPKPLASPAQAPTPLASTTNTQSQALPKVSISDLPNPTLPSFKPQAIDPIVKQSKTPESSAPITAAPNFFLGKPGGTPSSADSQPSKPLALTAANISPAPAPAVATKPPFAFDAKSPFGPATPSAPSQPPSSSNQSVPLTTSKPSFSFGPSSSQVNKSEAPKSTFSFGTGGGSTPSTESGRGAIPNFFAKPETQKPAASTSTEPGKSGIPNFFSKPATQKSETPTPAATAPPSTGGGAFTFNPGSQPAQGTTKSTFQFGVSGGQSNAAPSSGGGSLLNRMGPPQGTSQTSQASSWPTGGGTTASSPSPFGTPANNPFGPKTPQSQPPSSNPFGIKTPQSQPNAFGSQTPQSQPPPSSSNMFGQKHGPGREQQPEASKPALFGPGTNPGSELAKSNPFGAQPSTTGGTQSAFSAKSNPFGAQPSTPGGTQPAFSFSKPSAQAETPSQPASTFSFSPAPPAQQSTQAKPQFSFNFGGSSTPTSSPQAPTTTNSSTPAANPFNPNPTPSTGAAPAPAPALSFNFAKPTSSTTPSPFTGFGSKPADSEKK